MPPRAEFAVETQGLKDLRRDLRAMDRALPRELGKALREGAGPVVTRARAVAPVRSGRLRQSIRSYSSGTSVSVGSRLPYANVVHWGGTAGRGHRPGATGSGSVKFRASRFVERAVEDRQDELVDSMGDAIEQLASRHGFKQKG